MAVVSRADLPHVLVLLVVWAEVGFIGGIVTDEECCAQSGGGQATDEDDDNDGRVAESHGVEIERETWGLVMSRVWLGSMHRGDKGVHPQWK